MTALKWIGGIFAILAVLIIVGNNSPNKEKYARDRVIGEKCEQMMSDSALGNERRMTRQLCDDMKARNK